MTWPPSQDDWHPIAPRPGWSGPVAYTLQTLVLVFALFAVVSRHREAMARNHAAVVASQARIEAAIRTQFAYIRARDALWAEELGWPAPPAATPEGGPR